MSEDSKLTDNAKQLSPDDDGDDDIIPSIFGTHLPSGNANVKACIFGMLYFGNDSDLATLKAGCPEIQTAVDKNPSQFETCTDMKWVKFHDTDKGSDIEVTEEGASAVCIKPKKYRGPLWGTVRAARWSPPGAPASATVRVDRTGRSVAIGVLTDRYADCRRDWEGEMWESSDAWCYTSTGAIYHDEELLRRPDLPPLTPGSMMRVTVNRRVTFLLQLAGRWAEQFAFDLPPQCGNIALGVTPWHGSKVTLLP